MQHPTLTEAQIESALYKRRMNKRLFWTTAALLTTTLGTPLSSRAQQTKTVNPTSVNRQATSPHVPPDQPIDVVKVGEYQSRVGTKVTDTVIARIQPHQLASSRQAATLYVRNIPVFTFVGSGSVASGGTKVGAVGDGTGTTRSAQTNNDNFPATDPVWRATQVAAKLNQLSRDNVDAGKITVNWQAGGVPQAQKLGDSATPSLPDRYVIKVNGEELVEINPETRLADTTNDLAKDALQATNRLRRLLGNAPPLRQISGRPVLVPLPKLPKEISLGPVRISLSGWASWYGPECQGSRSASGEIFDQNELTAAHRSLPFGTQVRVTNMLTGRSVVVRINDRGPYIQGRIIDLSTAAARLLGLMEIGVAPVRVEVLSNQTP